MSNSCVHISTTNPKGSICDITQGNGGTNGSVCGWENWTEIQQYEICKVERVQVTVVRPKVSCRVQAFGVWL